MSVIRVLPTSLVGCSWVPVMRMLSTSGVRALTTFDVPAVSTFHMLRTGIS